MKNKKIYFIIFLIVLLIGLSFLLFAKFFLNSENLVKIETSKGDILIELYPDKAPLTVENFKLYVNEGFYDKTVFHRVVSGFMIQGGGFSVYGTQKKTHSPIKLESNNGLSNTKGTIAMARTLSPNSATSQFFINTKDNKFLDYGVRDEGYAVFGKVVKGMDVVLEIEEVATTEKYGMKNWPVEEIIINKIEMI